MRKLQLCNVFIKNMKTIKIQLNKLNCGACKKLTEKMLSKVPGVMSVTTDLVTSTASICTERDVNLEELNKALAGSEYSVLKILV